MLNNVFTAVFVIKTYTLLCIKLVCTPKRGLDNTLDLDIIETLLTSNVFYLALSKRWESKTDVLLKKYPLPAQLIISGLDSGPTKYYEGVGLEIFPIKNL